MNFFIALFATLVAAVIDFFLARSVELILVHMGLTFIYSLAFCMFIDYIKK